eukprot:scaffold59441_cov45-Phaeocystis_antarctica.AAC.3
MRLWSQGWVWAIHGLGQGCGFGLWAGPAVGVRPAADGALAWLRVVLRTFDRSVSGESLFLPKGGGGDVRAENTCSGRDIEACARVSRGENGDWWGSSSGCTGSLTRRVAG